MTRDTPRGTILVVDDNLDICGFAKMFLETAGYTVVTAPDGQAGLRRYEEHRSSIVLLLTDVTMPNINGFQLADRVLAIDSKLPVLFMSGNAWIDYRRCECILKPFRPAELVKRVNGVLSANTHVERTASAA